MLNERNFVFQAALSLMSFTWISKAAVGTKMILVFDRSAFSKVPTLHIILCTSVSSHTGV